jgi:hypothetical protein
MSRRKGRGRRPCWAWGLLGLFLAGAAPARAADTEYRTFAIQVDGRPAGDCRMKIERQHDGTEVMSAQVDVHVRFLLSYTFTYQGGEVWKGGILQSLHSNCNDNGKRYQVAANAAGARLAVRVNGAERSLPADVYTTSFWKVADAHHHNQALTLLDVDRGKELARQLHYLGQDDVPVGGQQQKCYHFRVTGGPSPIDLWFDGQQRMVRQDFVELGHRTVVQLTAVQR